MQGFLELFSRARDLAPHGYCLMWNPWLVWTHVLSDALIAAAYFSIPVALIRFVRRRGDVAFGWIFWLFAIFILACGLTHIMAIWTLWNPDYVWEGMIKVVTAIASVATAVVLWPLIPRLLAIPSPSQLVHANARLEEEALQRQAAETALVQSQKMEAVGQLTGGIAHDFNNMLSIVIGSLDMASRRIGQGQVGDVGDLIAQAQEGARRAAELTSRLMAFSRQQPLEPQIVRLDKLVADISELLRRTIGEQIQLQTVLAGGLWSTQIDPHQLENCLVNLCVNARDAMPNGGKLTIETANAHLDDRYAAENEIEAGQYVLVCVTDTGTGMSSDVIGRAFDPFFTTKPVGQGTGLGLSQVFGFIKQSSGHVKIYSEIGHGTTVKIYLPRVGAADLEQSSAQAPAARSGEPGRAGETVLVVEDEALVRMMTVTALTDLGYVVLQAANGKAALALIETGVPIDLLLTDVVMPEMNGAELAAAARPLRPSMKIIFMTGYTRNAIVHNGTLDPGVALLPKPFAIADLAAKVRTELDR